MASIYTPTTGGTVVTGGAVSTCWKAFLDYSVTDNGQYYIVTINGAGLYDYTISNRFGGSKYANGFDETYVGIPTGGLTRTTQLLHHSNVPYVEAEEQVYWELQGLSSSSVSIRKTSTTQQFTISYTLEAVHTWYKENSSGTITEISPGGISTASVTITIPAAIERTIHYELNGGSGSFPDQTVVTDTSGYILEGCEVTIPSTTPTKTNYPFTQWNGSNGYSYTAGFTFSAGYPISTNLTLTAQWGSFQETTVKFTYSSSKGVTPGYTYATNSEASPSLYRGTLASAPTLTGSDVDKYDFSGWSGGGSTYQAGQEVGMSGATSFTAVWSYSPQNYSIFLDYMGGTYNGASSSTVSWRCTSETGASVTITSPSPTKEGFTFLGWSKSSSATTATYTPSSGQITMTLSDSDGDFTLYAVYAADSTYTYTQGSLISSTWRTFLMTKVTNNGQTSVTVDVISGLYCNGNSTSSAFIDTISTSDGTETPPVASWGTELSALERPNGMKIVITHRSITVSKRDAYTLTITSVLKQSAASSTQSMASTNISIPAGVSYSVTYDANGGSSAPSTQTKYYDVDITISEQQPVRPSFRFLGWSTDSSQSATVEYTGGETYSTNADLALYAVWTSVYSEKTVADLQSVTAVCPWGNDTIAAISGTTIYQIDVNGDKTAAVTLNTYTGTPKMVYGNGCLVVMTSDYTAIIVSNGYESYTVSYDTTNILTDATVTTYGIFGLTSSGGIGTLTVPSR